MIKKLKTHILEACMLLLLLILAGCGTLASEKDMADERTDLQKTSPTAALTAAPTIVLTATPTVSPTPVPTVIPTPEITVIPTEIPDEGSASGDTLSGIPDDFPYDINWDDPLWVLSSEGERWRYDQLAVYFNVTADEVKVLIEAYYYYSNEEFNGNWYNIEQEEYYISDWIKAAADVVGVTYEQMIPVLINGYTDGSLDPVIFEDDTDGYLDTGEYPDNPGDLFEYYSVKEDDDPNGIVDFDDSYNIDDPGTEDSETASLPISSNGIELQIGDKVEYTSDDVFYYGGTVRVIDGTTVQVTWEMKGDLYSGPNTPILPDEKSIENMIWNPFNMPYDNDWFDASSLERIDNQSW